MTMPNFLIIGAPKAGTTSIYRYLKQHPQIYMSPAKEPRFFAFEGETLDFRGLGDEKEADFIVTDIDAYRKLFKKVTNQVAIGEASTSYLYIAKSVERIKYYIPKAKLIAILRDPAERAYSNYLHLLKQEREPLTDFAEALAQEEKRIQNNWWSFWHYKHQGLYYVQMKRYYEAFEKSQIKVYLYEDLNNNPIGMLKDMLGFLQIDDTFTPDISEKVRQAPRLPKNKALESFLNQPHPVKSILSPLLPTSLRDKLVNKIRYLNRGKPKLSTAVRKQLIEFYREDILQLQDVIGRDLSQWLKC